MAKARRAGSQPDVDARLPAREPGELERPAQLPQDREIINCPCGFVVKAETDDKPVAKAQAHAKETHQMDLTREQALAMAKPA